ncbi:MAG: N-acetyltransferase [Pseudomonadota bacterium]
MTNSEYTFATKEGPLYKKGGPVIFAFHGTGGDEHQFLDAASQMMPEAKVIAPRGDVSEMGAARFFKRTGEGQYDFDDLWKRTEAVTRFVSNHVEASEPGTVIGLGYSNGANILAAVIDRSPNLFQHAALMHPLVTWDIDKAANAGTLDVLITAGARDPICPPDMTGKLADMLEDKGASVRTWWHRGGHEVPADEMAEIQKWFGELRAKVQGSGELPIQREDDGKKGRWFMRAASGHEAEMSYTWGKPGCIIIDHTGVPDVFKGQGLAKKLYRHMVDTVRAEGTTIVPLCPFVASMLKRYPEDHDIVDDHAPARVG